MTEPATLPQPPDLTTTVFDELQSKANLPVGSKIVLGLLAGAYIGFGGLFAIIAMAGAEEMAFGAGQVLAGVVFALGLVLVLVGGAELFTGNTLMLGPVARGEIPAGKAAWSLTLVYMANFAGSVVLAFLVAAAGAHEAGDGAVLRAAVELGQDKTGKSFWQLLASGILANALVCLAVWLAYGGKTVTQKIAGLLFPIAAFVAAGLEHSVANMFLLPYAYLVQPGDLISLGAIGGNLIPATVGNIIGGGVIALAYGYVYPRE